MKNISLSNVIPSLLVIGGCLALSQVAQAEPAFHGTLTIRVDGDITASSDTEMPGMEMPTTTIGDANMLTLPTTGEVVGEGTGDFTALKIRHGDAVTFSTTMLMPGMDEGISFAVCSGLMISSGSETFIAEGPHRLHIEAPVMVMDMGAPGYGMASGELNGYFVSNGKGGVSGYFTIDIPATRASADKVKKAPFPAGYRP